MKTICQKFFLMCRSELFWTIVDQFWWSKTDSCSAVLSIGQCFATPGGNITWCILHKSGPVLKLHLKPYRQWNQFSEKMDHHHWRMSASHYKWFLVKNCCKSREILKMNLCFVNFALDLTFKMVYWYCWSVHKLETNLREVWSWHSFLKYIKCESGSRFFVSTNGRLF